MSCDFELGRNVSSEELTVSTVIYFLFGVRGLSSVQCFDTAGWVRGRTSGLKNSCASCDQEILLQMRWRKKSEVELADFASPGKCPLNGSSSS